MLAAFGEASQAEVSYLGNAKGEGKRSCAQLEGRPEGYLLQRQAVRAAAVQRGQSILIENSIGSGSPDPLRLPSPVRIAEDFLTSKCAEVLASAKGKGKGGSSKKQKEAADRRRQQQRQQQREQR